MAALSVVIGVLVVAGVIADVINTLVTTTVSRGRWWPTIILYQATWRVIRWLGHLMTDAHKERVYSLFAPLSVIALLMTWVSLQVVGFGMIWWGIGGIDGAGSLVDSIYYSGVVYFTLGFGEIVPTEFVPQAGALVEAFSGVLTTALVIGYLPALYAAYSQREQQLLMLDDGTEGRITPTNLVLSRCPTGDPHDMDSFFAEWEAWVAHVMETHTTFRMLVLFRSQHPGQNWITALGVVMDAALHVELMEGQQGRSAYWLLRRGTRLLQMVTDGADLAAKRADLDDHRAENVELYFRPLYDTLQEHGFPMRPFDEAFAHSQALRMRYEASLEFMIDALDAPRGFWGHAIGHRLDTTGYLVADE